MKLNELSRKLSEEYVRLRREKTGTWYTLSPKYIKCFDSLAKVFKDDIVTDEDVASLMRAAFSVKWWLKVKGEWVCTEVPYPAQLKNVHKYRIVFEKLRDNGEEYSLEGGAVEALKRSISKFNLLVKDVYNPKAVDLFYTNGTLSKYYAVVHPNYMSYLQTQACTDPTKYALLQDLERLQRDLILQGLLGVLKKIFRELNVK